MSIFYFLQQFSISIQGLPKETNLKDYDWDDHKEFLTLTPSLVYAEQPWICQGRSRIWCNDKPSVISDALAALSKSCLLAKTSNGTPCNFSSSSNSDNSYNDWSMYF